MKQRWTCERCGAAGTTKIETAVVFHQCAGGPPPDPGGRTTRSLRTREEALTSLWIDAFARAVDDEALLRRIEK